MSAGRKKRIALVLVGPTGAGKTYLSSLIAEKLPVEIVSADSRQIYKYLTIGTAKPPLEMLETIPHHFIDYLEPDQPYSAGKYCEEARQVIEEIFARHQVPLIVGGSGLYLRALLEGFWGEDIRDERIRLSLQHRLEEEGPEALHKDLEKVDPEAAKKIHPRNSQRIVRALEVYLASGMRISELQKQKMPPPNFTPLKFGVTKPRKMLYEDINRRTDEMFRLGLLTEVATLLGRGYPKTLNALNTVGYKEVIQFLDGEISFEACVSTIKRNTRRYAKRQLTWFRADPEIHWFEVKRKEDYLIAAAEIARIYRRRMLTPGEKDS